MIERVELSKSLCDAKGSRLMEGCGSEVLDVSERVVESEVGQGVF